MTCDAERHASNPEKVDLGRATRREGQREGGKDSEAEADDG